MSVVAATQIASSESTSPRKRPTRVTDVRVALEIVNPLLAGQGWEYSGTKQDLPRLQRLIDGRGTQRPLEEHEMQAVELLFGDILTHELGLEWATLDDPMCADRAIALEGGKRLLPLHVLHTGGRRDSKSLVWLFQVLSQYIELNQEWTARSGMQGGLICRRRK
jgi:hypothetical protein